MDFETTAKDTYPPKENLRFDELRKIAHSGHWSFDELLEWYHDQKIEIETLNKRIAELERQIEGLRSMREGVE